MMGVPYQKEKGVPSKMEKDVLRVPSRGKSQEQSLDKTNCPLDTLLAVHGSPKTDVSAEPDSPKRKLLP